MSNVEENTLPEGQTKDEFLAIKTAGIKDLANKLGTGGYYGDLHLLTIIKDIICEVEEVC